MGIKFHFGTPYFRGFPNTANSYIRAPWYKHKRNTILPEWKPRVPKVGLVLPACFVSVVRPHKIEENRTAVPELKPRLVTRIRDSKRNDAMLIVCCASQLILRQYCFATPADAEASLSSAFLTTNVALVDGQTVTHANAHSSSKQRL